MLTYISGLFEAVIEIFKFLFINIFGFIFGGFAWMVSLISFIDVFIFWMPLEFQYLVKTVLVVLAIMSLINIVKGWL